MARAQALGRRRLATAALGLGGLTLAIAAFERAAGAHVQLVPLLLGAGIAALFGVAALWGKGWIPEPNAHLQATWRSGLRVRPLQESLHAQRGTWREGRWRTWLTRDRVVCWVGGGVVVAVADIRRAWPIASLSPAELFPEMALLSKRRAAGVGFELASGEVEAVLVRDPGPFLAELRQAAPHVEVLADQPAPIRSRQLGTLATFDEDARPHRVV